MGIILSSGFHRSAITPVPILNPGLANRPERDRKMDKVTMLFANPDPREKIASRGRPVK
jgi:hypothetical protein